MTDDLRPGGDGSIISYAWESAASGLAAVWARENTREAIWDAMARKEVYATTGNRLLVRVFGGWDFSPDEVDRPDFAKEGYARGVPMGGDLTAAPDGAAPKFLVRALRDPDGANLDRIQMVKGWLDADGETQERVYDVAWSGDREPGADGKLPPVGYDGRCGERDLHQRRSAMRCCGAHWEDPEFDPSQRAFYYVRVLEIPTPRWTGLRARSASA